MKKLIALCLLILTCVTGLAGTAVAERDWSVLMTPPTEEQLSQLGNYRSPYITFLPGCDPEGFTAFAMDLRIAFDPEGTYICPACWNLDVSVMQKKYTRVWSDEGGLIGGYFGFQEMPGSQEMAAPDAALFFAHDFAGAAVNKFLTRAPVGKDASLSFRLPPTVRAGSCTMRTI